MKIIPYLYFDGTAEAALNFYKETFQGEIEMLSRYSDAPEDMPVAPGMENKLMHGRLRLGDALIYVSDAHGSVPSGHSITLEFDDVESLNRVYEGISKNGKIQYELQDTFWGARYGKLTDQFGVNWDLNYQYPQKEA